LQLTELPKTRLSATRHIEDEDDAALTDEVVHSHGTTRIIGESKVWSWFSDCGGKGASRH
jgi:hypothetical protein